MNPLKQSDTQDLFGLLGTPDFEYRELARASRDQASGSRWSLVAQSVRELRALVASRGRAVRRERTRTDSPHFVVTVVSPTGGAGRSTVTAGVVQALSLLGHRAIGIDLDPQNTLGLSFGSGSDRRIGIAHASFGRRDSLSRLVEQDTDGATCIPFGDCSVVELDALEEAARKDALWLRGILTSVVPADRELVLIDTPNQRTPWMKQALELADLVLVVVPPDGTSLAALPRLERNLASCVDAETEVHYLVNRFDGRSALAHDVVAGLRLAKGERMIPFAVQSDPAVPEAVAMERTLMDWALGSQVAADFTQLAEWIMNAKDVAKRRVAEQQAALAAAG